MKQKHTNRAKVLVVDDDEEQRFLTCVSLGDRYSVLSASGGEEALRIARKSRPAVILLDVMMPGGMDGFAVFRALREEPMTHGIPVIFLTEVNRATDLSFDSDELEKQLGARPAGFLEKPVSAVTLLQVIGEVAGGTRAESEHAGR